MVDYVHTVRIWNIKPRRVWVRVFYFNCPLHVAVWYLKAQNPKWCSDVKVRKYFASLQCCGSITFWGGSGSGSGSAVPCLWLMDPDSDPDADPDPAIFVIYLPKMPTKKNNFVTSFLAYYFLKVHVHHFQRKEVKKKSQSSRNQGFSYCFCLVIEGSRSGAGSGSIPLTDGSGSESRRVKNMWIRWIRIRIRIRNRNTASLDGVGYSTVRI